MFHFRHTAKVSLLRPIKLTNLFRKQQGAIIVTPATDRTVKYFCRLDQPLENSAKGPEYGLELSTNN